MGNCICKNEKEEEDEIKKREKEAEEEGEEKEDDESSKENGINHKEKFEAKEKPNIRPCKKLNGKKEMQSLEKDNKNCELYNTKLVEIINKIRTDPKSYIDKIMENIKYIKIEKRNRINKETGEEEEKEIPLFHKKIKVILYQGESRFKEAAETLRKTAPMGELTVKDQIKIPLPETEDELLGSEFIKTQADIIRKTSSINTYFKDYIKDPEISALLMIVDDCENFTGKKRNTLLNPAFKYIGVDSKYIGKRFVAHLSFSK